MPRHGLHRFEHEGRFYALDPETCFCFECDAISWDVLEHYPHAPVNRIYHLLGERHPLRELQEVVSELEWLRASKSILSPARDNTKDFQVTRGLRELQVLAPSPQRDDPPTSKTWWGRARVRQMSAGDELIRKAGHLLLARSGPQQQLRLEIAIPADRKDLQAFAEIGADLIIQAHLAGKELVVVLQRRVDAANLLENLRPHDYLLSLPCTTAESLHGAAEMLSRRGDLSLSRLPKLIEGLGENVDAEILIRPRTAEIEGLVETLDRLGFRAIRIDLDHAFLGPSTVEAARLFQAVNQNALYYVSSLLQHRYFRVEPFAGLFARIHNGEVLPRKDPAGTNALAVDDAGGIYPAAGYWNLPAFACGSLLEGRMEEEKLAKFEDLGVLTMAACGRCWARNLCGGGASAVHQALTGRFNTPAEPWCDAQRAWLSAAIAAFNQLATAGVNFSRIHQNLGVSRKPSLFAAAKAAFSMQLGLRPPEESDAEWLQRWENWNDSAYFTATEYGLLLATRYDREMDALHPRGVDREFVLVRRNGEPMGLLRVRPERLVSTARVWLYLRSAGDYAAESVKRSLRAILQEAARQQGIVRLLVPVGPADAGLAELLPALGFRLLGVEREAVYLHARHHDLQLFFLDLS